MLEYEFNKQLEMSNEDSTSTIVKAILLQHIPSAVNVYKSALDNDRQGIDWWVETSNSKHLGIDVKIRKDDWLVSHPNDDDIALESWSVVEKKVVGWTRDISKKCDYILWLWISTGRFCLVPFPMLCSVFLNNWQTWSRIYKTRRQVTPRQDGEYQSECIFVPRRDLWAAIYKQYGGNNTYKQQQQEAA